MFIFVGFIKFLTKLIGKNLIYFSQNFFCFQKLQIMKNQHLYNITKF